MIGQFTFLSGPDYAAAVIEFEFPAIIEYGSMTTLKAGPVPSFRKTRCDLSLGLKDRA